MYRDGRVRGIWTLYDVITDDVRVWERRNGKKVWGMCMDMWERRRESKRNRWDERIRDGENGMRRYGKVEGE